MHFIKEIILLLDFKVPLLMQRYFLFFTLRSPRSTAAAVIAKNSPQDCFLNALTVLKEISSLSPIKVPLLMQRYFFCTHAAEKPIYCQDHVRADKNRVMVYNKCVN